MYVFFIEKKKHKNTFMYNKKEALRKHEEKYHILIIKINKK